MKAAWPAVSLGDVCELRYGKPLPAPVRSGTGFSVYGSNGEVGRHSVALTDGPTIVVGRKGSFGEVHFSSEPCWPIDTTYYVNAEATTADLRWLFYRMKALPLTELNRAAAVPGLNREDAYSQELLLPPIEEQRRIAAVLDAADALRAKRRQALATLDTLTQAIFIDMFGDPRGSRLAHPRVGLGEVVDFLDHLRKPITANAREAGPYPYYGANGVQDSVAGFIFDEPLVLLAEDGGHFEDPRRGVAYRVEGKCWVNNHAHVLRPKDQVEIRFLAQHLKHADLRQYVTGATRLKLTKSRAEEIEIILPPLNLQHEFGTTVRRVESSQAAMERSEACAGVLFTSLQQRAFRGEL